MGVHQYSKPESKSGVVEDSPAVKRAKSRGYSGRARKIKIQNVTGSESSVVATFYAGLLGPFTIRRGFDIIVPEEVVEAFRSSNESTTIQCDFNNPDRTSGHVPVIRVPVEPRFPYQDFGEATWEEYEAFLAEQRLKPNLPVQR